MGTNFIPKSVGLNFSQNNMGFQWQHLYKDILERKSILLVKVSKLDFRVLCQPTTLMTNGWFYLIGQHLNLTLTI